MSLESFIRRQKADLQRSIDEHNNSCIEIYGEKDAKLSAYSTGFLLYVYEKTCGKIGFLDRFSDKTANVNYFKNISSETSLEKLAEYRENGAKRLAISPLFIYTSALTLLNAPLSMANLGLFFYFLGRGGREEMLAQKRIRELVYKEVPLEEKEKQLEERLHIKKKEKLTRYLKGVATAEVLLPLSALLILSSTYQGGSGSMLLDAPFFLIGSYFGLSGIGQFFGIKKNLKKEEAEIKKELSSLQISS